ncbi:MAG: 50S ribosomal protein L6 [Patescibacteria group bacterium]
MSRIGKQLIKIPVGVEVKNDSGVLTVKGPKGELKQELHRLVSLEIGAEGISLKVKNENDKNQRALWGLFGSLIKNMILGVTVGFSKGLEINGIGYKAALSGRKIILNVGFSHPVEYNIPNGVEAKIEGNVITVSSIDKQLVGEVAAQIRRIKKPEPYKGSGIRYVGELVRRKAGKTAGK